MSTSVSIVSMAGRHQRAKRTGAVCLLALAAACSSGVDTATQVNQAVNIFTSGVATGGAAFTVDAKGNTAIAQGVEFPGFAFGTYDVDASSTSVKMTLVANLANLQITEYDSTTVDQYFYEFDRQVTFASIAPGSNAGFAASVRVVAPGETVTSGGTFVTGLPTSFTFANGGILVSIGQGTSLTTVGTGGSMTVDVYF